MLQVAGEAYKQKMQALHSGEPRPGPFRMGFHSIPSMNQLHMHVISQVSVKMSPQLVLCESSKFVLQNYHMANSQCCRCACCVSQR